MKKVVHFRLEPINIKNNDLPHVQKLRIMSQILCLKKGFSNRSDGNKSFFRINSQLLLQCMRPFNMKTKVVNPDLKLLKIKNPFISQQSSRNQDDNNDEQGSRITSYAQLAYDDKHQMITKKTSFNYQSQQAKNQFCYSKSTKNIKSSKENITPIPLREPLVISDDKYHYNSIYQIKHQLSNESKINKSRDLELVFWREKYNNNDKIFIDDKKKKTHIKSDENCERNTCNSNINNSGIDKEKERSINICKDIYKKKEKEKEKERKNSFKNTLEKQTSFSTTFFAKRSINSNINKHSITKSESKIKPMLNKREVPLKFNSISQIERYHNYNLITLYNTSVQNPVDYLNHRKIVNQTYLIEDEYNYTINNQYCDLLEPFFSHRINWTMVDKSASQINFQWKYFPKNVNYRKCAFDPNIPLTKLTMCNLFENNSEIGNKKNLFINLVKYCNKINVNVFEIIPFTIILSNGKSFNSTLESLEEILSFLKTYTDSNSHMSTANNEKKDLYGIFLNRLYKEQFPNDFFDKNDKTKMYFGYPFISKKNYWILKPVDLYKGIGIQISDNTSDIKKMSKKLLIGVDTTFKSQNPKDDLEISQIEEKEDSPKKGKPLHIYCSSQVIIQKYLDHPLLYKQRKFDIRCFVLVDHNLNVFYFREGHLKGCSIEYDIEQICPFAHITNYSFQKHSEDFSKYEIGNEMSYKTFKEFLVSQHIPLKYFDLMIQKMKYAIEISMNSIGSKLNKRKETLSFEIFGYDFIIDRNFTPWILEINNNPGLGISSPVIEKIVPRMIDDSLRLTIDTVFDTKYSKTVIDPETKEYRSKYPLEGYSDSENLFEFICNINKPP